MLFGTSIGARRRYAVRVATWGWDCEDEEEALGVEAWLRSAGIEARIVTAAGSIHVEIDESARSRVEDLRQRVAAHYVRKVDASRTDALARRHRKGIRLLLGAGALLFGLIVALYMAQ